MCALGVSMRYLQRLKMIHNSANRVFAYYTFLLPEIWTTSISVANMIFMCILLFANTINLFITEIEMQIEVHIRMLDLSKLLI